MVMEAEETIAMGGRQMKTVTVCPDHALSVRGELDVARIARGHTPRKSGAGIHADRRLRRHHTRGAQIRRVLTEG